MCSSQDSDLIPSHIGADNVGLMPYRHPIVSVGTLASSSSGDIVLAPLEACADPVPVYSWPANIRQTEGSSDVRRPRRGARAIHRGAQAVRRPEDLLLCPRLTLAFLQDLGRLQGGLRKEPDQGAHHHRLNRIVFFRLCMVVPPFHPSPSCPVPITTCLNARCTCAPYIRRSAVFVILPYVDNLSRGPPLPLATRNTHLRIAV